MTISITEWDDAAYEREKKRHAALSAELVAGYASSDWGWIRERKDQCEELGRALKRYEQRLEWNR